jgi:hypothetical protein
MFKAPFSIRLGSDLQVTPAPIIERVTLSDEVGNQHPSEWPGLIDTGADRSAVPISACHYLRLLPHNFKNVRGFDPSQPAVNRPLYMVRLHVGGLQPVPLLAYGVERQTILLGRDFLSKFTLVIDGPSSSFMIGQPRPLTRHLLRFLPLR